MQWQSPVELSKAASASEQAAQLRYENRLVRVKHVPGVGLAVSARGELPPHVRSVLSRAGWHPNPELHSTWVWNNTATAEAELPKLIKYLGSTDTPWLFTRASSISAAFSPRQVRAQLKKRPLPHPASRGHSPASCPPKRRRRIPLYPSLSPSLSLSLSLARDQDQDGGRGRGQARWSRSSRPVRMPVRMRAGAGEVAAITPA